MQWELLASNLLSPPVLFFVLGLAAVLLRSDLEFPQPIPKILSLYLLFAIGFKGGSGLRASEPSLEVLLTLTVAMLSSVIVPVYVFFLLRRRLGPPNAAAIAAAYGSVSAVTFITATSFLGQIGVPFGSHLIAALALMESPAIVVGIMLLRLGNGDGAKVPWSELLRDAFLNGSVFVLVGSMVVGAITTDAGRETMHPFIYDVFTGALCLFLLDMGIVAGRRLGELRKAGLPLIVFGIVMPLVHAGIGLGASWLLGLSPGDALLVQVLFASASYIAVPAAFRMAVPEANPSIYVTLSLALTFPFNIAVGIPLYFAAARWLLG